MSTLPTPAHAVIVTVLVLALIAVVVDAVESTRRCAIVCAQVLAGTPVVYGSVVQLLHLQSRRYVGILNRTLADVEKHCTAVNLRSKGRPTCYWRVMPRFKYRREGEKVRVVACVHRRCQRQVTP